MVKILYGPPGDSSQSPFFNSLPDDPQTASNTLWITPTQRKRQWVQDQFRNNRRLFPPRIHVFDELIGMLYDNLGGTSRRLSPEAVQTVLMNLILDPEMEPLLSRWFDRTPGPGFISETARQIDEFQRYGIASDTLAAIPDSGEDIGSLFNLIYTHYQNHLDERGWIDTGGMGLWVADRLAARQDPALNSEFRWKSCIMDGFLELTPLQLDILNALESRMDLTLIWPGNPAPDGLFRWMSAGLKTRFPTAEWAPLMTKIDGPAAAAFSLAGYGPDVLPEDIAPVGPPDVLRIIERDTVRDEVTAIARDIRRRHDSEKRPWTDIAVTFPDLQGYAPVIRRIFERYAIPVNISQSLPITGSPVYIAIDRLLRLPAGWSRDDVLAVMSDVTLTGLQPPETRQMTRRLIEWSSRYKIVRGLDRWITALDRSMEGRAPGSETAVVAATAQQLFRRFAAVLDGDGQFDDGRPDISGKVLRTPGQWIEWLRTVLTKLEINRNIEQLQRMVITTLESGSEHFEYTRRAYNRLLEYFDATESVLLETTAGNGSSLPHGTITLSDFRALLPRMLAGIDYQLTTRTGDRVQVLGLLGIRGLTFRHVYFGGLTERVFPRKNPISPFWRPDLKTTILDQPDHSERITAFGDLIRVMLAPSGTLTLSRPCRDGDEKLLPSSLWDYVPALYPRHETVIDSDENLCVRDRLVAESRERIPERVTVEQVRIGMAVAGQRRSGTGRWCGDLTGAADVAQPAEAAEGVVHSKVIVPAKGVEPTAGAARQIIDRLFDETHTFSASQLETYLACPRMFFFDKVLGLREPESPEEEMSNMDRGTLVHRVLHRFYLERLERGMTRVAPGEEAESARRIREIAAEEFDAMGYSGEAARRQYLDITGRPELNDEGIAHRFACLEAMGSPELHPALLEWTFGRKSTAPPLKLTDAAGKPVLIEGKIDRLDRCAGDAVIWDYKTGQLPGPKAVSEFRSIQISLYMLAAMRILGHPVNAGGFYHLPGRIGSAQKTAIRLADSEIGQYLPPPGKSNQLDRLWSDVEFAEYFDALAEVVVGIASEIRRGAFPVASETASCANCGYIGLCHRTREIEHVRD